MQKVFVVVSYPIEQPNPREHDRAYYSIVGIRTTQKAAERLKSRLQSDQLPWLPAYDILEEWIQP